MLSASLPITDDALQFNNCRRIRVDNFFFTKSDQRLAK